MNILVIGNGGREHALAWKIGQSPIVNRVFMTPMSEKNEEKLEYWNISHDATEELIAAIEKNQVELVVVGPEIPLMAGIADKLRAANISVFGPGKRGALLEGSKIFAKEFMVRNNIPTAPFQICTSANELSEYIEWKNRPMVVKLDGLAGGKGVFVPKTIEDTIEAGNIIFSGKFGEAPRVLLEEKLKGTEVSIMFFTDGEKYKILAPSQDHKRLKNNNKGPNTGGMGAYTPVPFLTEEQLDSIEKKIIIPIIEGLKRENIPYRGVLYAGLMITKTRIEVLEFNCRFGDPETQALMVAMNEDIVPWLLGTSRGNIPEKELTFKEGTSIVFILADEKYPENFENSYQISGLDEVFSMENIKVFFAGAKQTDNQWFTSGGRVLGITAFAESLAKARKLGLTAVKQVSWPGRQYRADIGQQFEKTGIK